MNLKLKFESAIKNAKHNVDICDVLVDIAKEFAVDIVDSLELELDTTSIVIVDNFVNGIATDEEAERVLLEEEIEANMKPGTLGKEE